MVTGRFRTHSWDTPEGTTVHLVVDSETQNTFGCKDGAEAGYYAMLLNLNVERNPSLRAAAQALVENVDPQGKWKRWTGRDQTGVIVNLALVDRLAKALQ